MKDTSRKVLRAFIMIVGVVILCQCDHTPVNVDTEPLTITEFPVGIWYADENQNIQENILYQIESQEQMDELFATYSSNDLPNINFNEHTLFVVWGASCHAQEEVLFEQIDEKNYVVKVSLIPSIDTGPDLRWSFGCITSRKLQSDENVSLKILVMDVNNEN